MIATKNVELGHSSVLSAKHGCTQLVLASQKVVALKTLNGYAYNADQQWL